MSSLIKLTEAITCRYHGEIRKACAPLFNLFNLSHFGYCKIMNSGGYLYFGSNVAWSEYFAAERLYLNFPYYRHPKYVQEGVEVMKSEKNKKFSEILNAGRDRFNLHHNLAFFNKIPEGGVEGFVFSTGSSDMAHLLMLLSDLPLLRLFIRNFRKENQYLFDKTEENQINLIQMMGTLFYENAFELDCRGLKKRAFLQEMGIDCDRSLTEREADILKLIVQGYSAGKIASQICLSKRTVEHHIERVKEKLGCGSKMELIQKARELEQFGCLNLNKGRECYGCI